MENYTLNTESKDIVGGINEVDYVNQFTFINGESDFWGQTRRRYGNRDINSRTI